MSELKPCPFCGSEDVLIERYGDPRKSTIVSCQNCACVLESNENFNHGADWNRRPIEDALRAQLAELKAEVDRWRDDHIEQERVIDGLSEQLAESQKRVSELEERNELVRQAIENLRRLPETRRGPFLITDQELDAIIQKGKDNEQS